MEKENLRVGIIGAGNWANYAHLPAFAAQSDVSAVGITDINSESIRAISKKFGIPSYADLEQMLRNADLNVLDVITSRGMHFEPVMKGMAHNLDILCEKPLGHTIKETCHIYQESRKRKLVTHMGFTFRYSPAVQYLRDLVQDGFLGEVFHVQEFEENAQLVDPKTPLPRIGFSRKTDSGALHGYGSHLLDLVRWRLGEFEQVIGDMATFIKERPVLGENTYLNVDVDDSTIVLGRMMSGIQATMQFSKIAMGNGPGVEMRVFGSKAALWVRLEESPEGYEHLWVADLANRNFRPLPVPTRYLEGHNPSVNWPQDYYTALVRHFIRRVRQRDITEGLSDFSDGLRAQELLEAIERSHFERRWVTLNSYDLDSCFPGNPDGSHSERVAAAITPLLADSNVILDLHGGGSWCVNAFVKRFAGSEDIADDMEAPFISNAPNKPGGLTSYAKTLGIQVTNIEVGGRSKDEMFWCGRIVNGLERVLYNLGLLALAEKPAPAKKAIDVNKTEAVRSRMGGIFVPTLREEAVGTMVPAGTEMGKILDLHTLEELEIFTAPYAKTAMMLLRPEICVLEGSALIYVIAEPV